MGLNLMSLPTELHMRIVEFVGYNSLNSLERLQKTSTHFDDLVRRFWNSTDQQVLRRLRKNLENFEGVLAQTWTGDKAEVVRLRDELWETGMWEITRSDISGSQAIGMTAERWCKMM